MAMVDNSIILVIANERNAEAIDSSLLAIVELELQHTHLCRLGG